MWPRHSVPLAILTMPFLIVAEASLSFLGLGIRPPQPTWGNMIAEGAGGVFESNPHIVLVPGAALLLTVLALNVIGQRIRKRWIPGRAISDLSHFQQNRKDTDDRHPPQSTSGHTMKLLTPWRRNVEPSRAGGKGLGGHAVADTWSTKMITGRTVPVGRAARNDRRAASGVQFRGYEGRIDDVLGHSDRVHRKGGVRR